MNNVKMQSIKRTARQRAIFVSAQIAQQLRALRGRRGHEPEIAAAEHQSYTHADVAAHQALLMDTPDTGNAPVRIARLDDGPICLYQVSPLG